MPARHSTAPLTRGSLHTGKRHLKVQLSDNLPGYKTLPKSAARCLEPIPASQVQSQTLAAQTMLFFRGVGQDHMTTVSVSQSAVIVEPRT